MLPFILNSFLILFHCKRSDHAGESAISAPTSTTDGLGEQDKIMEHRIIREIQKFYDSVNHDSVCGCGFAALGDPW
jgi:hypothetical protein